MKTMVSGVGCVFCLVAVSDLFGERGMGGESWGTVSPTVAVAAVNVEREEHWKHFDNSVNAVSFGFVATAILISMFLVMAIFERFWRPRSSSSSSRALGDPEAPIMFDGKLRYPSPKMTVYARGVSVLMPGEQIPTYIAHLAPAPAPAPAPCPPERIARPPYQQHTSYFSSISRDNIT